MKRRWRALAVLVLLGEAAADVRFFLLKPEPVPVVVALAAPGPVEATVTNTRAGSVRARRRAKLSPEIGFWSWNFRSERGAPARRLRGRGSDPGEA